MTQQRRRRRRLIAAAGQWYEDTAGRRWLKRGDPFPNTISDREARDLIAMSFAQYEEERGGNSYLRRDLRTIT